MRRSDAIPYVSFVVDDAGCGRELGADPHAIVRPGNPNKRLDEGYNVAHVAQFGPIPQPVLDRCRELRDALQSAQSESGPARGDIVELTGKNGKFYRNGHIESFGGWEDDKWHCCTGPQHPFVGLLKDGKPYLSTSGGYWLSIAPEDFEYVGTRYKIFWTWRDSPQANGGVHFSVRVNVWRYSSESIY